MAFRAWVSAVVFLGCAGGSPAAENDAPGDSLTGGAGGADGAAGKGGGGQVGGAAAAGSPATGGAAGGAGFPGGAGASGTNAPGGKGGASGGATGASGAGGAGLGGSTSNGGSAGVSGSTSNGGSAGVSGSMSNGGSAGVSGSTSNGGAPSAGAGGAGQGAAAGIGAAAGVAGAGAAAGYGGGGATGASGGASGTAGASGGGAGGACTKEICNGIDDDCDGQPDNGFACVKGSGPKACSTSCGTTGQQTCSAACALSACAPPAETCNLVDDDCNGLCDEVAGCRHAVTRGYNPSSNEHFYTVDLTEATNAGYQIQGASYFSLYSVDQPGLVPFYRCVLTASGYHFYTASSSCEGAGFVESSLGNIATSPVCGATPLYRLASLGDPDHLYTIDASERDAAVATGYVDEGIAGYVWP